MYMKKTVLTTFLVVLFISSVSLSQTSEAYDDYINAMAAPSLPQKIKLLKDYLAKYKGRGTQHENYVYANLCIFSSQTNNLNESIEYGENALTVGGLDDSTKSQLYITLSTIYTTLGKNLEKAKNYAMQVVEIAQANKDKESATTTPEQWNQLMGAGYYIHAQAQDKAGQNKGAVSSYIKSYNILKNKQILNDLRKAGKALYDFKFYKDAEEAFKMTSDILQDYESYSYLGKCLFKSGKKEEAVTYFKKAYAKKKGGELAYNIGIILAGNSKTEPSPQEAIHYLLEASFLSPSHSEKARALAESLFFNSPENSEYNKLAKDISEKGKKLGELIEIYNEKIESKKEDELTEKQRKIMKEMLVDIETQEAEIKKLEAKQSIYTSKFNKLLEETKKRLGIK